MGQVSQEQVIADLVEAVQRLERECQELRGVNQQLATNWVRTLITNMELMDEYIPAWRLKAGKEITELKELLNDVGVAADKSKEKAHAERCV
ncbi:MAG: hypothetical protein ACI35P_06585 [Bacillus sp. (in: firmicutes)]